MQLKLRVYVCVSYQLSVLSQYHYHWGQVYSGPVSDLQGKKEIRHETIDLAPVLIINHEKIQVLQ